MGQLPVGPPQMRCDVSGGQCFRSHLKGGNVAGQGVKIRPQQYGTSNIAGGRFTLCSEGADQGGENAGEHVPHAGRSHAGVSKRAGIDLALRLGHQSAKSLENNPHPPLLSELSGKLYFLGLDLGDRVTCQTRELARVRRKH